MSTYQEIMSAAATGWNIPGLAMLSAETRYAGTQPPHDFIVYRAHAEQVAFTTFFSGARNINPIMRLITFAAEAADEYVPNVPAGWIAPVAAFWESLITRISASIPDAVLLDTIEQASDQMTDLIDSMDIDSLADVFEASMGQAAVASIRDRLRKRTRIQAFSAAIPSVRGIPFAPLADAVERMDGKTPIAAVLSSREWKDVPLALRERAFFSAKVESVRFLASAQDKLQKRLSLERERVGKDKDAFINRDSFLRDMRRIATEEGIDTAGPAGRGTVRDIRSVKRLGMIYDIQADSAAGYARWKMDHDPDVIDEFPAYRLGESTADKPRGDSHWRAQWADAGSSVGWQGAARVDMIALKTSPIWSALSAFGSPWPPFDFGSTRMLEDVDRQEAAALGLIKLIGPVPQYDAGSDPSAFNDTLEASVTDLPPVLIDDLRQTFGDQVQLRDNKLQWQGNLIQDFVNRAIAERSWNGKAVSLGVATKNTIAKAKASGIDLANATLKIDPSHIRKTWRDHGPAGAYHPGSGEKRSDQLPLSKKDYELIPHLWRHPDEVNKGKIGTDIVMQKKVNNTLIGAAWTISGNKKTMTLKSFYKSK